MNHLAFVGTQKLKMFHYGNRYRYHVKNPK